MGDGSKEFHYPYVYFEFPHLYLLSHFHITSVREKIYCTTELLLLLNKGILIE